MPRTATAKRSTYDAKEHITQPFDLEALAQGGPDIEILPADRDLRKLMEDAKFMNEPVQIRFHETGDINAPKAVEIHVTTRGADGKTGVKHFKKVFPRGVNVVVPRYVVEAMAHSKETSLTRVENPRDPMDVRHVNRNSFYYPFEVIRDDNPKGRAWLDKVLADPA